MTPQQKKFLTYIRTLQMFELRFKGEAAGIKPVHIKADKVGEFFPTNRQAQLKELEDQGELIILKKELSNGWTKHFYTVTKAGEIDFNLIPRRELPKDSLSKVMIAHLKNVSLPNDADSTPYFDCFLRNKEKHIDKFVTVDNFGHRFHSPVTSFPRDLRDNLLLEGKPTTAFDIVQSQPTFLAIILREAIGQNEFSQWIEDGQGVYEILMDIVGLPTRDKAKDFFYKITFSWPSDRLSKTFGNAPWVQWINQLKKIKLEANPHGNKPHTNMAFLLQRCESKVMRKVWQALADAGIPFITIHDEIRTPEDEAPEAEAIIKETLNKEYHAFKVSSKGITPEKIDNATTAKEMAKNETPMNFERWTLPKTEIGEIMERIKEMNNPQPRVLTPETMAHVLRKAQFYNNN